MVSYLDLMILHTLFNHNNAKMLWFCDLAALPSHLYINVCCAAVFTELSMGRKAVLEQSLIYSDLEKMKVTLCSHFWMLLFQYTGAIIQKYVTHVKVSSLWCYENSCALSITAAKSDGQTSKCSFNSLLKQYTKTFTLSCFFRLFSFFLKTSSLFLF